MKKLLCVIMVLTLLMAATVTAYAASQQKQSTDSETADCGVIADGGCRI